MPCLEEEMRRLHQISKGWCKNASVRVELRSLDDGHSYWFVAVEDEHLPEDAIEGSVEGTADTLVVAIARCEAHLEIRCAGFDPYEMTRES